MTEYFTLDVSKYFLYSIMKKTITVIDLEMIILILASTASSLQIRTSSAAGVLSEHRCGIEHALPSTVCARYGGTRSVVRTMDVEIAAQGTLPYGLEASIEALALHPIEAVFEGESASAGGERAAEGARSALPAVALALEVVVRVRRGGGARLSRAVEDDVCRAVRSVWPTAHASFCGGAGGDADELRPIRALSRAAFALNPLLLRDDGVVVRSGGFGDGCARWMEPGNGSASASATEELRLLRTVARVAIAHEPRVPAASAAVEEGWAPQLRRRARAAFSETALLRSARARARPDAAPARTHVGAFGATVLRRAPCAAAAAAKPPPPPQSCVDLLSLHRAATDAAVAAALPRSGRALAALDAPCRLDVRARRTLSGVGFHRSASLSLSLDAAAAASLDVVGLALLQPMPEGAYFDIDEIDELLRFHTAPGREHAGVAKDEEEGEGGGAATSASFLSASSNALRAFVVGGVPRAPLRSSHGWTGAMRFGVDIEAPAHRALHHALAVVLDARPRIAAALAEGGSAGPGGAGGGSDGDGGLGRVEISLPSLPFHLRYRMARDARRARRGARGETHLPAARVLIGVRCGSGSGSGSDSDIGTAGRGANGSGGDAATGDPRLSPSVAFGGAEGSFGWLHSLRAALAQGDDDDGADDGAAVAVPVRDGVCWRFVRHECGADAVDGAATVVLDVPVGDAGWARAVQLATTALACAGAAAIAGVALWAAPAPAGGSARF